MKVKTKERLFTQDVNAALANPQLRANFRGAMDFLRAKRKSTLNDENEWQALKKEGAAIRAYVINNLPRLLLQLEEQCLSHGIQVHWAENGLEANEIILNIAKEKNVKNVIKGKSMASEEIELNAFLQQHGISCVESDMGEYIVQIANETPSHIIMPAIHKNKAEIADLFEKKIGVHCDENDVDGMIGLGRKILREKFEQADIGISGVNFAIADSGTLCLVENEGNGRLSTTAPPVHIALMGIEKVIPTIEALPTLQSLLTRSATGQEVTTYLNLINSPRKQGELDGPHEVHLILLDNGRSNISQDEELKETLACIRCGACMNHCPVYTKVGGHAYGSTYPGPIGQVLMPQLKGLQQYGHLVDACSLNGACGETCPVNIELPSLIRKIRHRKIPLKGMFNIEKWVWESWKIIHKHSFLYQIITRFASLPSLMKMIIPKTWSSTRTTPEPAKTSLHHQLKMKQKRESS